MTKTLNGQNYWVLSAAAFGSNDANCNDFMCIIKDTKWNVPLVTSSGKDHPKLSGFEKVSLLELI